MSPLSVIRNILVFSSLVVRVYCQTSLDGNGNPVYSATPVQSNPNGIPTLVYNCAKLPSICNNVNTNYALNPDSSGNYRSTPANQQGYYVFNVDKFPPVLNPNAPTSQQRTRIDDRRNQAGCTGNWNNVHPCPENNQPLVVPNPFTGGSSVRDGFMGTRLNPNGNYAIANAQGTFSGMAWTCDEFPAASWVEGGNNPNLQGGHAATYCAPGAYVCGTTTPPLGTEQNWQGAAHAEVSRRGSPDLPGNTPGAPTRPDNTPSIWTIHFSTLFEDEDGTWATAVAWYDASGEYLSSYPTSRKKAKRADTKHLITHMQFTNGSVVEFAHEVPADHGLAGGTKDGDSLGSPEKLERKGYRRVGYRHSPAYGKSGYRIKYRYEEA